MLKGVHRGGGFSDTGSRVWDTVARIGRQVSRLITWQSVEGNRVRT